MNEEIKRYTAESIKKIVEQQRESLFAPYASGRPDNWSCDLRTKDLVCIGNWLALELTAIGLSEEDRRTQEWKYNRESRSDLNLFECAAQIMNEALDGKVEKNRLYHRRWG
jgi:hypothetical protein